MLRCTFFLEWEGLGVKNIGYYGCVLPSVWQWQKKSRTAERTQNHKDWNTENDSSAKNKASVSDQHWSLPFSVCLKSFVILYLINK